MGFVFEGKAGAFRLSNSGWPELLAIAEEYGWKPAGTSPPDGLQRSKWDGDYCTNDGQCVTARDARALAAAIGNALEDDFQRVRKLGQESKAAVTDAERQQAFEKLASVASRMTFEIEETRDKRTPRSKRNKEAKETKAAGSLEELAASQGLSLADLVGSLSVLKSPAACSPTPDPWFTRENGRALLRDFVAFCKTGGFRIL